MSGLPSGGLADALFTITRTGWVVIDTDRCAAFKSDCTQTSDDRRRSATPGSSG